MGHRCLAVFCTGFVIVASCSSRDAAGDRAASGASTGDTSGVSSSPVPWLDGALPVLLVPAHSNDRALIVPADSSSGDLEEGPLGRSASLFRLDGSSASVRVILSAGTEGCVDAVLEPAPDRPWGAGLVGGSFGIQRVDSLGAISRRDSTALSAVVFRLASTVPNSAGGRFAGLPFSLADLWRLPLPGGGIVVVAATKRQINQEDSPLEERTLIVLETDSTYAAPVLAYSTRSTGPEETVEGSELLAAVTAAGSSRLFLVFAHDFGDQTSYSLVERSSPRGWKLWWASRRFSC